MTPTDHPSPADALALTMLATHTRELLPDVHARNIAELGAQPARERLADYTDRLRRARTGDTSPSGRDRMLARWRTQAEELEARGGRFDPLVMHAELAVAAAMIDRDERPNPDVLIREALANLDGKTKGPRKRRRALGAVVATVWSTTLAAGDWYVHRHGWADLFKSIGWVNPHGGVPRPSPAAEPVTLYRGAPEKRRDGIAWTDRPDVAGLFAARDGGRVWTVTLPPSALLAAIPMLQSSLAHLGGPLIEYIVDPEHLSSATIRPHEEDGATR